MSWYTGDVRYWIDQGPLSATVDHAAATALVDAAAAVWNVDGMHLTLTGGGSLSEDVGGSTVYLGAQGPVWPADLQSSNYTAKAIAVVFDTDGAVTEMLLGSGASAPSNCRVAGVTENVDLFIQPGRIAHALIVLNGRCTGSAPEQQLQLQYQLVRAFGRVLGLGWSQTNDNVFTGIPAPTYAQQMHWPIMHPIDIVCGPFTYQCLPEPFTLRDDDRAGLELLYGSTRTDVAIAIGSLNFPTGQPMNGVNITVQRAWPFGPYGLDPYQDVSSVSGYLAKIDVGNPVTGPPLDTAGIEGTPYLDGQGAFRLVGIPLIPGYPWMNVYYKTEPINPLYTGRYAVGPYRTSVVEPSGSVLHFEQLVVSPMGGWDFGAMRISDAAALCNTGEDGTESAPAHIPSDGHWSGQICAVGHTAWMGFAVRAGRSATLEVTATDAAGLGTPAKALPVLGLWHASDSPGSLPTMARALALNASQTGMTQMRASFSTTERVRFAIADARGDGRPDFTYFARLLYADSVQPSQLEPAGGAIRIAGMGFESSSRVTVGGVLAQIVSQSATEIVATAPPASALGNASLGSGAAVNVTVTDTRTGALTTISAGLTYGGGTGDVLTWAAAPAASVAAGMSAVFRLRVVNSKGDASAGAALRVTASGPAAGQAIIDACGLAQCTLLTDAAGTAQGSFTAFAAGTLTLRAVAQSGSALSAIVAVVSNAQAIAFTRGTTYIASGPGAEFSPAVTVTSGAAPAPGQPIAWTSASSRLTLNATATSTGIDGRSATTVAADLRDGEAVTLQACAWTTVCATGDITGVAAGDLRLAVVSGAGQSIPASGTLDPVVLRVVDLAGHPVAGAAVAIYQVVTGWQPPCSGSGRCPVPPLYGKTTANAMSDEDGLVQIAPLQYAAVAGETRVTATAGTVASVTVPLTKTP